MTSCIYFLYFQVFEELEEALHLHLNLIRMRPIEPSQNPIRTVAVLQFLHKGLFDIKNQLRVLFHKSIY